MRTQGFHPGLSCAAPTALANGRREAISNLKFQISERRSKFKNRTLKNRRVRRPQIEEGSFDCEAARPLRGRKRKEPPLRSG